MEDVKKFYEQYYGPNNATLVIAGDFDIEKTKKLAQKYFREISSRGMEKAPDLMPVQLDSTISLYHEDTFAKVPELRLTWPTVHQFHEDKWALDILGQLLSGGEGAPLYEIVVKEKSQASNASAYHRSRELAGIFTIRIRANAGTDLDSVKTSAIEGLNRFEEKGINPKHLNRIKMERETLFYNNLSSVLFKSFRLAFYSEYAGSPDFMTTDIQNIRNVTREDVMRVYKKYIKDKNYVITSFVPKNKSNLTVTGSKKADVKEETIIANKKDMASEKDVELSDDYTRTSTSFNRTKEPPLGEKQLLNFPEIWTGELSNGMGIYGIENNEVPLVNLSVRIKGGHIAEDPAKAGTAYLLANLMMKGTKDKTPEELKNTIGQLGAGIKITVSREFLTLSANCLSRNYEEIIALVREILLEPRWDKKEFERIKKVAINSIRQRKGNADVLASTLIYKKLYGKDHILGTPVSGSIESVSSITLEDLKTHYDTFFSPSVANFHVAGNISEEKVKKTLGFFEEQWTAKEVILPEIKTPEAPENSRFYFTDLPNARQSQVWIGRLTVSANDEDYYPLTVAEYHLGGSNFGPGGILFQVLREEKGYTYAAYSEIERSTVKSPFIAAAGVKSDVTDKALDVFKELIADYGTNYTEEDLQKTKNSLIRADALKFETLPSLLDVLQTISTYDLPLNYNERQQQILQNMDLSEVKRLIEKYLNSSKMVYVIVGDKATQFEKLNEMEGVGELVEVDRSGNRINFE